MKPGDKLADARSPGLRIHAGNKRKRWLYRFKDPRKVDAAGRLKLTELLLGYYPEMGLADARRAWMEAKLQRKRGEFPEGPKSSNEPEHTTSPPNGISVVDLCRRYVKYAREERKKRSWLDDEKQLWRDLVPRYGHLPAIELSRDQLEDMLAEVEKRGPRAAQKLLAVVRGMFNVAVKHRRKDGWDRNLQNNPAANIELDRYEADPVYVKGHALQKFLHALREISMDDVYKDALRFQLLTCSRPGEVCNLPWSEVDMEAAIWALPQARAKNGRAHDVYLSEQAVELLRRRIDADPMSGWVFPSRKSSSGHIRSDTYAKVIAANREALVLPNGFTPHSIRHSAVTNLASIGCPKHIRNRMTNHKEQGIDARYQHHEYDAEARNWWQQWANQLTGETDSRTYRPGYL
jgi:integrase